LLENYFQRGLLRRFGLGLRIGNPRGLARVGARIARKARRRVWTSQNDGWTARCSQHHRWGVAPPHLINHEFRARRQQIPPLVHLEEELAGSNLDWGSPTPEADLDNQATRDEIAAAFPRNVTVEKLGLESQAVGEHMLGYNVWRYTGGSRDLSR